MIDNRPFNPARITIAFLIACKLDPNTARAFERGMQYACAHFDINTVARLAAFIGQCAVESGNFTRLEESLYYTSVERLRRVFSGRVTSDAMALNLLRKPKELANTVYADRLGNGDAASGDGWRYRGRGLIQLTGKNNYASAAAATKRPYEESPDLVAQAGDAAVTAGWYWQTTGCNQLADMWDIDAITRRVNGPAMAGKTQRRERCQDMLDIITDY